MLPNSAPHQLRALQYCSLQPCTVNAEHVCIKEYTAKVSWDDGTLLASSSAYLWSPKSPRGGTTARSLLTLQP